MQHIFDKGGRVNIKKLPSFVVLLSIICTSLCLYVSIIGLFIGLFVCIQFKSLKCDLLILQSANFCVKIASIMFFTTYNHVSIIVISHMIGIQA